MNILHRIRTGEVSLAFRKWRRPTVKAGGSLTTPVGVLRVESLETCLEKDITPEEARLAGFESEETMIKGLGSREGTLYRIQLSYLGADPRIALRQQVDLSEEELESIHHRLEKLDVRSKEGAWTLRVLEAIRDHPKTRAADLAVLLELEKTWLKAQVRKLKSLGLTESQKTGYTLSPRGELVLNRWSLEQEPRNSER